MVDRRRRLAAPWVIGVLIVLLVPTGPSSIAHGTGQVARTVDAPESTTPDTTQPETTEPETTEPETTEPGSTQPDDPNLTGVTVVGVIAFALLIALASWWMIQRRDDDDAPHPRPPNLDEPPPGQDLL